MKSWQSSFPRHLRSSKLKPSCSRCDALAQAELNLRYCQVVSEIDGVVTGRNVNPGDNIQAGQSLMAVRSLTEILDHGQLQGDAAPLPADWPKGSLLRWTCSACTQVRGPNHRFRHGNGQTLALLPPQNATGNFVKIVQRLPVRIDLIGYHPDMHPLFDGLSVVPYVYYNESPEGPNSGAYLQPYAPLPQGPTQPTP